ncbi:MAG: DUF2860 family protein [Pontiella sp.]
MAWSTFAIDRIPEESGFSGFISAGIAVNHVTSSLIAGASLGDVSTDRIDSVFKSPQGKTAVMPAVNGGLAYTFAATRSQVYFGTSLEDFIRYDFTTALGIRQEVGELGIIEASALSNIAIPAQVYQDPYQVGGSRKETERQSRGARLAWYRMMGSGFDLQVSARKMNVDNEQSGSDPALNLTLGQQQLLERGGDEYKVRVQYQFRFNKKHTIKPTLSFTKLDLDGGAMKRDRVGVQLSYLYNGARWFFTTGVGVGSIVYDEENPIYKKKADSMLFNGSISLAYKNLFNIENLSLLGSLGYYEQDSEINFYDASIQSGSLRTVYSF